MVIFSFKRGGQVHFGWDVLYWKTNSYWEIEQGAGRRWWMQKLMGESKVLFSLSWHTLREMGNHWPDVMSALGSIEEVRGAKWVDFHLTAAVKNSAREARSSVSQWVRWSVNLNSLMSCEMSDTRRPSIHVTLYVNTQTFHTVSIKWWAAAAVKDLFRSTLNLLATVHFTRVCKWLLAAYWFD